MKVTANVFTWVDVSSSTPIRYVVNDGHVDFTVGTPDGGVELTFDQPALKRFLDLAAAALDTTTTLRSPAVSSAT